VKEIPKLVGDRKILLIVSDTVPESTDVANFLIRT